MCSGHDIMDGVQTPRHLQLPELPQARVSPFYDPAVDAGDAKTPSQPMSCTPNAGKYPLRLIIFYAPNLEVVRKAIQSKEWEHGTSSCAILSPTCVTAW